MKKIINYALAILLMGSAAAIAAVPGYINFQGRLLDANKLPRNETVTMIFKICDDPTAGTCPWTDTQSVTVTNGVFAVKLGAGGTPLSASVFSGAAMYLDINVGGEPLLPREQLLTGPYSFKAAVADSLDALALTEGQIAAGAVSLGKMSNLAANSMIGNNTESAAVPLALTAIQVRSLLNVADGANNYVHPNHSGDVTSVADGANTIAAGAVSLAKMANLAANSMIGNNTAGAAVPLALTAVQVRSLLNVADGANNYTHPNHTGDVTSVADGANTIAAGAVTLGKMANLAANSIVGNNTGGAATPLALTATQVRTLINVADGANNYVHPNHTGDVTSVADGANTIAAGAVTVAKTTGVSRSVLGTWGAANLTTSQTALPLLMSANNTAGVAAGSRMKMPFAGIVKGMCVFGSAARTAGTATFMVYKNAANISATSNVIIDATNTQSVCSNAGVGTFVAGDILDIRVTTLATWAPTTAEWTAQIIVEWTN